MDTGEPELERWLRQKPPGWSKEKMKAKAEEELAAPQSFTTDLFDEGLASGKF